MSDADEVDGQETNYIPLDLRRKNWVHHYHVLSDLFCDTNGWMLRQAMEARDRAATCEEAHAIIRAYGDFSEKLRAACFRAMDVTAVPEWVLRLARELGTLPSDAERLILDPDAVWPLKRR